MSLAELTTRFSVFRIPLIICRRRCYGGLLGVTEAVSKLSNPREIFILKIIVKSEYNKIFANTLKYPQSSKLQKLFVFLTRIFIFLILKINEICSKFHVQQLWTYIHFYVEFFVVMKKQKLTAHLKKADLIATFNCVIFCITK